MPDDSYRRAAAAEGPLVMLLSAAIFGFFGFFYVNWNSPGVTGDPVFFRVLLGLTLKTTAILFAACAAITVVKPFVGNLLYFLGGSVSAVLFLAVAAMDIVDDKHGFMPYGEFVLIIFAAWNGYGSWSSLRKILAARK
jgi:hypothetical protein